MTTETLIQETEELAAQSQALLAKAQSSDWRERYAAMDSQLAETQAFLDDFHTRWDAKEGKHPKSGSQRFPWEILVLGAGLGAAAMALAVSFI